MMNGHAERDRLVDMLVEMRDSAIARMLRRGAIEPGHLPLIAGSSATLAVLDEAAITCDEAARAVVSDDGRQIRPVLYDETSAVATVMLDPWRAVRLAGRLLDAAGSKLVP
jgi:hypothetical protein